eukprot:scaffold148732_cov23-Tisochrysis_lutea.AAC.1
MEREREAALLRQQQEEQHQQQLQQGTTYAAIPSLTAHIEEGHDSHSHTNNLISFDYQARCHVRMEALSSSTPDVLGSYEQVRLMSRLSKAHTVSHPSIMDHVWGLCTQIQAEVRKLKVGNLIGSLRKHTQFLTSSVQNV